MTRLYDIPGLTAVDLYNDVDDIGMRKGYKQPIRWRTLITPSRKCYFCIEDAEETTICDALSHTREVPAETIELLMDICNTLAK